MPAHAKFPRIPLGVYLLASSVLHSTSHAQYATGSALYNETRDALAAALNTALQNAPLLEDIYYPAKYRLPTDFYVAGAGDGLYTQNVIFDPCRQYGFACCNDTYGTPEFVSADAQLLQGEDVPRHRPLRDDGSIMTQETSRRPDDELYHAPACTGAGTPDAHCILKHLARRPFRLMPRCWNFNSSVVADRACRAPTDGSPVELCVELGVTQNAFIVECGGAHAEDPHCGTYLEVHRPGMADVLSEARLPGMFTSGYRCVCERRV